MGGAWIGDLQAWVKDTGRSLTHDCVNSFTVEAAGRETRVLKEVVVKKIAFRAIKKNSWSSATNSHERGNDTSSQCRRALSQQEPLTALLHFEECSVCFPIYYVFHYLELPLTQACDVCGGKTRLNKERTRKEPTQTHTI